MVTLNINGKAVQVNASSDTPLLWVLREHLNLPGVKFGCGVMQCGACTVLVDGVATRTCLMPLSSFNANQKITTIEGLSANTDDPLQKAWLEHDVAQCGYCQSGMIMAAKSLLNSNPNPDDAAIDAAVNNICRCGTYQKVKVAIKQAAKEMNHA